MAKTEHRERRRNLSFSKEIWRNEGRKDFTRRGFQKRGIMAYNPDFLLAQYWGSLNVRLMDGEQMEKVIIQK